MNPFLSNLRAICYNSLIWALVGALFAVLLVMTHVTAWLPALWFTLPICLCFSFISASAYYVCKALPLHKRHFLSWLTFFGTSSFFSAGLWLLIALAWNKLCLAFENNWAFELTATLEWLTFILGTLLYLLSILCYDVLIAFDNIRQAERRQAASEIHAREAELQMLRTQINPHFLFNSLNSISALTAIDAAAARQMTIELAQFFRQTLALADQQKIRLEQEINLCQHFLAVEKIRFGKKLQTFFVIDEQSLLCLIPPMILQPLLENAIKHGIRDLVDGGNITVNSKVRDDWLYISIENPIDPDGTPIEGTGTGLKNLRSRFASLYGQRCRVDWSKDSTKFRVEIALPIER